MKNYLFFKGYAQAAFLILAGFLSVSSVSYAYTDIIETKPEDVLKAAENILKPYGIRKIKPQKGEITSRWIEDRVERVKAVLPIQGLPKLKQNYYRRYSLHVLVKPIDEFKTTILIKGKFQQKDTLGHPAIHWVSVKPKLADYDVEREFFFRLLREIEAIRRANPS